MPVVAFVTVVATVLTELSVDVAVAVDCDSVMKVVGVVALSKTYTVTFTAQQYLQRTPVSFSCVQLLVSCSFTHRIAQTVCIKVSKVKLFYSGWSIGGVFISVS